MEARTGLAGRSPGPGPGPSAAHDPATDIPVYATDILAYFPRPYLP
jgi:hypothetical protein